MDWNKWSGFQGEGVYEIFNKHSLLCLRLETVADPPDFVWGTTLEAANPEHPAGSKIYPTKALWVIDRGICCLSPGKMVVFRSVEHPGLILSGTISGWVVLVTEHMEGEDGEQRKWLLQKQPEA
ncbi:MAG: hypothetical protein L6R40_007846 [Gallowayella cf. fulva]|nr:MAG: hypothetical protein L6R40_007846 [Xanthomendoza cf. fulva]